MERETVETALSYSEKEILDFLEKSNKPMRTREIMHGVENPNYLT